MAGCKTRLGSVDSHRRTSGQRPKSCERSSLDGSPRHDGFDHIEAIHEAAPGDGIRVFIVSSVNGLLQSAVLHQDKRTLSPEAVPVRTGDTIDFVCDIGDVLNSDQHLWRIQINETPKADESDAPANSTVWNSESDFTPTTAPHLTATEQLAQILLCSNEFLFAD